MQSSLKLYQAPVFAAMLILSLVCLVGAASISASELTAPVG